MAPQTHEATRERELNEARASLEKLHAERADIDAQIEAKELLIQAWTNFELTLQGKFALTAATQAPRKARGASTSRAPRGERGRVIQQVQELLAKANSTPPPSWWKSARMTSRRSGRSMPRSTK